jgi:hypothetical protein
MKYVIDQSFRCSSRARFEEVYFSEEFNDAVAPVVGLKKRELVAKTTRDDGRVERRVRMEPTVQLPAAVKRLVGDKVITYDEVSVFDEAAHEVEYFVDHAVRDRVEVRGTIRFVDDGGGRVRRVIDGEVEAHVLGLSRVIEKLIQREVKRSYERIAEFMQRYLDDNA